MTTLRLSEDHRAQIEREARAALPRECCGLLEGKRDGNEVHVTALHTARNLSKDADRFEIDPADQFKAIRAARTNGHMIVGCYHSHPHGKAEPSARDGEGAWDEGAVWVIAAVGDAVSFSAHARVGGGWKRLQIVEKAG